VRPQRGLEGIELKRSAAESEAFVPLRSSAALGELHYLQDKFEICDAGVTLLSAPCRASGSGRPAQPSS